jgi:hypothetical protein
MRGQGEFTLQFTQRQDTPQTKLARGFSDLRLQSPASVELSLLQNGS